MVTPVDSPCQYITQEMRVPCLVFTINVGSHRTSLRSYVVTCRIPRRGRIDTPESVQTDVLNERRDLLSGINRVIKFPNLFLYVS